ncbi:MAG: hypothetical protein RMY16_08660 [Nostoc sp. DedQUE12b]|uniref:PD-(D/E)XK nuclease superfamily protein n=1 Tax=Nostoc sp. DedQUE12b TaxID=3075398 RepID=UPI002AD51B8D|nr:PD-(D/E)XK nuclease superfamily protein [Nostoc sp. DedQUE12b]MDZ8085650.1 hypothetical protein [Nostoc sp. DedQUE12b]
MALSQGGRANKSGQVLETTVEGILRAHEYYQVSPNVPKRQQREYILNSTVLPKRYARSVYIGTGIYQTDLYVDFYVIDTVKFPSGLIIECKWQESGGSVDEKFPYLNLNIQSSYPAPTILVMGGEGMRQKALDWFKKQVDHNQNLLAVYSLDRFIAWSNNHL